jgi:hypothetical protein
MNAKQTRVVFASCLLVLVCWLGSLLLAERDQETLITSESRLLFNGTEAFQHAHEFVTRHPIRSLGALEARQSSGYLRDHFNNLGYEVSFSHFEAIIGGRNEVGRNVLAYREGTQQGILSVIAHYDTAPSTVQGATDNGAAIGILLELARVCSDSFRNGLLFIASDGEEWGMLGASEVAANYAKREDLIAVLSLDGVAAGKLAGLRLDTVGQFAGYSPPWLRRTARAAAAAEGLPVVEPSGLWEHLERAIPISATDQGPFLRAGIPAINLGSESTDAAMFRSIYHSAEDTIDNIQVGSLEEYGRAAERLLRSLDALSDRPQESMEIFRIFDGFLLPPLLVTILHYLTFLPILFIFYFNWKNHEDMLSFELVQREMIALFGTFIPFLISFTVILLLLRMRLLPLYGLYPPPPGDPVLENPSWGLVATIMAAGILSGVILYFIGRYLNGILPRPSFDASKILLLGLLLVLIFVALRYNSYWAVAFLGLPAYVWGLVPAGKSMGARTANRIWLLAAGVTVYSVLILLAAGLDLGWGVLWYMILALSTGLFSRSGFLLLAAVATLGIRFLVIQSHPSREI